MKTGFSFSKDLVGIWGHLGWFSGEDFVLFRINLFELSEPVFTVFDLQIAKFAIGFGFYA